MKKVWIIGTGLMAVDHAKVLLGMNIDLLVIGRGEKRASQFEELTGIKPITGGIENYFKSGAKAPEYVINAVGIDQLANVTLTLIENDCKNILLEKPGVAYYQEINLLSEKAKEKKAQILLAYNRRFYQSVQKAIEIIKEDGGVRSYNFEFTEWSHQIQAIRDQKTEAELQNWFLGNSTHVIDLAFFLGGEPKELSCFVTGKNEIDWHRNSSNFSGAGISKSGALFSYHADWRTPGRFSVEILTLKHRLIFRPLEKLQIQNLGSVAINMAEGIDYSLDEKYKPGLFLQTKNWLEGNIDSFIDIHKQKELLNSFYVRIGGYA